VAVSANDPQEITPILAQVGSPPIPFPGSDNKTHLVYEIFVSNSSKVAATLQSLDVTNASTGAAVQSFDKAGVAGALQLANGQKTDGVLGPAQQGLLYLHLTLPDAAAVPPSLTHRLQATLADSPPATSTLDETTIATVQVDQRKVLELGPPLKGTGYLAADGCCDSTRHRRATLPVNGTLTIAQRYAIDWEQVDDQGRIYVGEKTDPKSYAIFGDEAIAVAAGTVVKVVDDQPEQVPGTFPTGISLAEADGNQVILDVGGGNWVLYAHMQPGSVRVKVGDVVKRGDVMGLVGNTGNSVAPHLHLHVMNAPLPLASSGLPYTIDSFSVYGQTVSTAAFDKAEGDGTPLEYTPVNPPTNHADQYPMDQSLVTFGSGTSASATTTPSSR
jgi:hypothetical protein